MWEEEFKMCNTYNQLAYSILENRLFKTEHHEYEEPPLIVTYRSKPIKGIVLELVTLNPKWKGE